MRPDTSAQCNLQHGVPGLILDLQVPSARDHGQMSSFPQDPQDFRKIQHPRFQTTAPRFKVEIKLLVRWLPNIFVDHNEDLELVLHRSSKRSAAGHHHPNQAIPDKHAHSRSSPCQFSTLRWPHLPTGLTKFQTSTISMPGN